MRRASVEEVDEELDEDAPRPSPKGGFSKRSGLVRVPSVRPWDSSRA